MSADLSRTQVLVVDGEHVELLFDNGAVIPMVRSELERIVRERDHAAVARLITKVEGTKASPS